MHQVIQQSKSPCWHTSGWNEKSNQRKKRKKRNQEIISINFDKLPRMKILSLIMMPIMLLNFKNNLSFTDCQLIVEHPKSYARPPNHFTFLSNPTVYQKPKTIIQFDDAEYRSNVPIEDSPTPDNITSYSTLPSSRAKQHELLRKLSSTMLLDTLLRQPIITNKSPFPPLKMLNNLSPKPANGTMDVSATNRTIVTDSQSTDLDNFNASSLHYLVDKLIKVQAFKQDVAGKRPSRRKSPYENIEASPEQNLKLPAALDVLIRDEYNSRVEPMLKSLMDQRRLAAPTTNHKSNSSLNNHKLDQVFDNDISATTIPSNVDRRKNNQDSSESILPANPSIHNTLVAYEELEDIEDDEEFDDELDENPEVNRESAKTSSNSEAKNKTKSTSTSSDRKTLQNVPPYQLGNNFGNEIRNNKYPALNSSQTEIQATTMSSLNQKDVPVSVSKGKKKISNSNEKVTDASLRDSLVFSDGADEDRANRRKNQSTRTNITSDSALSSVSNSKRKKEAVVKVKGPNESRHNGESSFLLDLFSTINPLTDLDKLKEPYNAKDVNDRNPLIYKGYVGSNDYMLSSTARDWSRPLNNRDPASLYKYLHNNQQHVETTPATPPSEPPTPPFSYFPNQPVTNAQSVPTMVIPTSDPPEMTTTPQPVIAGFEPSRRKIPFPNPQYGDTSRPSNNQTPQHHHGINVLLHNSSLKSLDKQQIYSNHDRKYSYQVPDRSQNKIRHQHMNNHVQLPNLSSEFFKPLLNHTSESPELIANNGVKNETSNSKLTTIVEVDRSWSPSKIIQSPQQDHKRLRVQIQNMPDNILLPVLGPSSPMNLSSPMLVPFVGMKGFGSTPIMNTIHSPVKVSPTDVSTAGIETVPSSTSPPSIRPVETTIKPTSAINGLRELSDHLQERPLQKNSTLTERRSNNFQRNKLKVQKKETSQEPSVTNSSETDDVSGDRDSEQVDEDNRGSGSRKSKKPTSKHRNSNEKTDSNESDLVDDYQGESSESSDERITTTHRPRKQHKDRTRASNGDLQQGTSEQLNEELKQNQTKKAGSYTTTKHDAAGSEISYVGFDKNLHQPITHRRNQSSRFVGHKQQPPQVNTETITLSGNEGDGVSYKPATASDSSSSAPTSFGSTIIPNSNFVGEASSDSPTLDSSIPTLLNGRPSGKFQRPPAQTTTVPDDPYQRISSSNSVVSTVLQPSSKIVTTTNAPRLLDSSSTTEIYRKQEDPVGTSGKSANDPVPTKPSSKGSSDRLAFILICGSCFLSVVCLVLAAMSVRCPDMFDDYRYMRNAERAALRLQKHRLRYTKNHQINRYNDDGSSPENGGLNLIDDLNLQTPGVAVAEPELNHMRNSTKCLNSRPAQFNHPHCKNTSDTNAIWNPSSIQQPLPGLLNKEQQACRCANCSNQRWSLHQEDLMAANKHLSWLHPYFYMQNHTRLRPLFGAGSSVGTFFPRRMDDQKQHTAGGSIDAQILIDSQPPHSCGIIDQRGATRSKSILNTNKKPLNQRHVNGLEVSQHDNSNFGCNNPAHSHSHHNCHNHGDHHHHLHHHRCNLETSTSDGSELTIDESFHHCDSAKCSAHHQKAALNNRLKLNQLRSVDVGHAHHSAVWKPRSFRKSTQSSHHHHHHHHPQVSSSEASSSVQCTCSKDLQPLLQANSNARRNNSHRTSHKRLLKHDTNFKQAKRDKSMLIWSSNLDRLI